MRCSKLSCPLRTFRKRGQSRARGLRRGSAVFGLVSDGEDGVARDERLQLDEVRAATLEVGDSAARIVLGGNGDGTLENALRAIEHGPRGINARADEAAGCDFAAPGLNDVEFTAHVANGL